MESFEDSNCHSMSDSFSLYERYLRSFNVVDNFIDENKHREPIEPTTSSSNCDYDTSNSVGNIELSTAIQSNVINKHCEIAQTEHNSLDLVANHDVVDRGSTSLDIDLCVKVESSCASPAPSLHENSSATVEHSLLTEKSDPADVPVSSEESKPDCFKQPVFITSTMENSNNAVDSVPMFCDVRHSESVFKLPISELSFNGTIKHVQKLKPIVDPITALTSASTGLVNLDEKSEDYKESTTYSNDSSGSVTFQKVCGVQKNSDMSDERSTCETSRMGKTTESTGDSQYEEFNPRKENQVITNEEGNSTKWNPDHSCSSDDSGVRSPDVFTDEEDEEAPVPEPFWNFLKDFEAYDKKKTRRMEERIQGVLPPPSVTILKTDVSELLKKYYCFLPLFNGEVEVNLAHSDISTPKKGVSFIKIPVIPEMNEVLQETSESMSLKCSNSLQQVEKPKRSSLSRESTKSDEPDNSLNDQSIVLNMCTETEAKETLWPNALKCRYFDVYYNMTKYSEKLEFLAQRCAERYVGAETDTSVSVHSGGMHSPSSASKRKALRLKMAQAKSPGRRLSHLARRRQAFCTAATISERAQTSTAKMVLIDKNFFPHRKLIATSERKSPRLKRTPGKKTPVRKTPGKKTPKTPKNGGNSSRKKAMKRLQMDTETLTRSQPTRETLKRALFISPDNRKSISLATSSSVPLQAMKSKRALFGSPVRAETKSLDGTQSDQFLKRKRDDLDDEPEYSRNKIAKSLSFGGDTIRSSQTQSLNRQTSEVLSTKNTALLNETHKKKLLWAVSEALRIHGWRMSSPGFREKASALARLTRRLLTLPPHAAKLSTPKFSTSETMLKLARQYVFAIIQGRSIEECFQEEQMKINNQANCQKLTGYISASDYQQLKARQATQTSSTFTSQIKENTFNDKSFKQEQPRSGSKNVLQDKLVNIDTSSNSSSGLSMFDKIGIYKSNSMPSFEEAAKMRARRQISFDNVDFPKR